MRRWRILNISQPRVLLHHGTAAPPRGYFHFVWLRSMAIVSPFSSTIPRKYFGRERAGYSNFRELTRGALTVSRRRSDINIVLPKRNTLSRGKFSPEDQGSKLFKSFPGVPNSVDFSTIVRCSWIFRKNENKADHERSLHKI